MDELPLLVALVVLQVGGEEFQMVMMGLPQVEALRVEQELDCHHKEMANHQELEMVIRVKMEEILAGRREVEDSLIQDS